MIDFVVVNLNTSDQLANLISSIDKYHAGLVSSVTVVDNASLVNSLERLQAQLSELPVPSYVIRNAENRGFAAACNQGAANGKANYLLFLNPDTHLTENSLDGPIRFMENPDNQRIGIIGIQLLDDEGRLTKTCSYHPMLSHFVIKAFGLDRLMPGRFVTGFMSDWDHKTSRKVDVVIGAFYLVRRSLFASLGGFDERFFVYFEEGDFSLRAWSAGYETYYLAEAQACHSGCGASDQVKAQRLFFSWQSRIRYGYKHFGRVTATLLLVVTLFIEPVSRLIFNVLQGSWISCRETLHGCLLLWRALPVTLHVK